MFEKADLGLINSKLSRDMLDFFEKLYLSDHWFLEECFWKSISAIKLNENSVSTLF